MLALDFIKQYAALHPGAILGSYCLSKLHGTDFNDIDYFTPLLTECLDLDHKYVSGAIKVKKAVEILGKVFHFKGKNYPKNFDFAAYECKDFDDAPVNLVMVLHPTLCKTGFSRTIKDIIMGFDLDILRVYCESWDGFEKVHTTKYYNDCILTGNIFNIVRNKDYGSWHDEARIAKYKKRFPDFKFIKLIEAVDI